MTQTVEDTRPRTESIIRRGALAGFALAGIKLLVLAAALTLGAEGHLAPLADLSNLVDVAIFAGLSLGVWRRSRAAAVLLPLYFVPSELFVFRQTGEAIHLPVAAIFLFLFVRAAIATFAYHRQRRRQDPDYRPAGLATYLWWIPGVAVLAAVGGLMAISLVTPPKTVQTGAEMRMEDLAVLHGERIVDPDEDILLFYSAGLFSVREKGNLITDRRLISYEEFGEGIRTVTLSFRDIAGVSVAMPGDALGDTLLKLDLKGGGTFYLFVSSRDGGDERFMAEIRRRIG